MQRLLRSVGTRHDGAQRGQRPSRSAARLRVDANHQSSMKRAARNHAPIAHRIVQRGEQKLTN
eukprot:87081-Pleurochrysis_carterae.AAC.4